MSRAVHELCMTHACCLCKLADPLRQLTKLLTMSKDLECKLKEDKLDYLSDYCVEIEVMFPISVQCAVSSLNYYSFSLETPMQWWI